MRFQHNNAQYFAIEKAQRNVKYGVESGLNGMGSGTFEAPCPGPPHPSNMILFFGGALLRQVFNININKIWENLVVNYNRS